MHSGNLPSNVIVDGITETNVSDKDTEGLLERAVKELRKINLYNALSQDIEITDEDLE